MNAILAPSSLQTNPNTTKPSSNNSSNNNDSGSFDSTLQAQTKALNQDKNNSNEAKTIKSQDLLGTIWSMQGNPNLSTQITSIESKIKFSSPSVSVDASDPSITTDISGELPAVPTQDLLAMIWSMQNNTSVAKPVVLVEASNTTTNLTASMASNAANNLTASMASNAANNLTASMASDDAKNLTASMTSDAANNLTASMASDAANNLTASMASNAANNLTASMASDAANNLTASMASDAAALALKNSELINNQINEEGNSLTISDSNQTALINSREPNLPTSLAPSANTSTPMSAPIPTYSITPSVSQSGWDAAINQRIVWMASQNIQSATLNINPEHLGPLQIQIQVDNNQQANIQFFSAQPEVRLALQNSLPMLSEMFEQTGIQLGQSNVSSQSSGSNQEQQKSNFNTLVNEQIKLDSSINSVSSTTPNTPNSSGNGLLNIYA